jgi:hypothetical protein
MSSAQAPKLSLPGRRPDAPTGSQFAKSIEELPPQAREEQIYRQIQTGNVPDFERQLVAVEVRSESHKATFYALPDYLAVGRNEDYFFVPMTPYTAQRIADLVHCTLPTPQMSNLIYAAATCKLTPSPIPPSPAMTTVPVFEAHTAAVALQRKDARVPLGALTAGDKKDIVICAGLAANPAKVAIYGWHKPDGQPIQPLYLGHTAAWADYSHGVRLIAEAMDLDGKPTRVDEVLKDPDTAGLLSSEGVVAQPRYEIKDFPRDKTEAINAPIEERLTRLSPAPGVRVIIDEPATLSNKIRLVLYALTNGNTIEETYGKPIKSGDDWHFDIQHIGAQTRFLRARLNDRSLVVAYLQTDVKAWPAYLRTKPAGTAQRILDAVIEKYKDEDTEIVLDSHSGGGALLFAYIRDVEAIPDQIKRIAFLDSEYNYETSEHGAKLASWLKEPGHFLCLIAYDDASALYQGKPFVSVEGGAWGRTHLMLKDLSQEFRIKPVNDADPTKWEGLDGRLVFWLKENPKHEIFHTVQVERNGFIESLLAGTPLEGKDYDYFGPRAYRDLIR